MPSPKPIYYAGVGARATPPQMLQIMESIGAQLAMDGLVLRTGGAKGADMAFIQGAREVRGQYEVHIPWNDFNGFYKNNVEVVHPPSEAAQKLASQHHPNWAACSKSAQLLHGRNSTILMGRDLNSPVRFVICWTPNGATVGGTGQCIRLAKAMKLKVFNLGSHEGSLNSLSQYIKYKLFEKE